MGLSEGSRTISRLRTLILIPTEAEAVPLRMALYSVLKKGETVAKICGFGAISSGIRTAQLLAALQPKSCLLIGVAGTYSTNLPIGSALEFDQVACYGIGAGCGSEFIRSTDLGWQLWPEPLNDLSSDDILQLQAPTRMNQARQLLTVCAAAACGTDVEQRRKLFPNALAEDMEAYAVGLACLSANVPLRIIRGISNRAGDRNKSNWAMKPALESAATLAAQILASADR